MQLYFAPMEGITGSLYRCAHHRLFGGVDSYYAPFIFTNPGGKISKKDLMEIAPAYNEGCSVVPQLLSSCAEDFIATARTLKAMGYEEVNLNLGCPSATVASKGRGAGFLGHPEELERFLDKIFGALDMKISVKTRIGMEREEEFDRLLALYGRYPMAQLIVHPRLRSDYYSGGLHLTAYEKAVDVLRVPVCYNGDIFTPGDFDRLRKRYPDTKHWMMGRGLLSDPALGRRIRGGPPVSREELAAFYHALLAGYDERLNGSKKVISLMKEFWQFIGRILSEEGQKAVAQLMRASDRETFLKLAEAILERCDDYLFTSM